MPTWNKSNDDGKIIIKIPLLGEVVTCAESEEDAEIAVKEAFHCFCLVAEKHGMGLENELEFIGWIRSTEQLENGQTVLNFLADQPVWERVMDTADSRLLSFAI